MLKFKQFFANFGVQTVFERSFVLVQMDRVQKKTLGSTIKASVFARSMMVSVFNFSFSANNLSRSASKVEQYNKSSSVRPLPHPTRTFDEPPIGRLPYRINGGNRLATKFDYALNCVKFLSSMLLPEITTIKKNYVLLKKFHLRPSWYQVQDLDRNVEIINQILSYLLIRCIRFPLLLNVTFPPFSCCDVTSSSSSFCSFSQEAPCFDENSVPLTGKCPFVTLFFFVGGCSSSEDESLVSFALPFVCTRAQI
uniref:Uncharacterized protein n=1 Tax=Romanomermis culicivorax TaxID=13658 RepID=A0A915IL15_ROMCU